MNRQTFAFAAGLLALLGVVVGSALLSARENPERPKKIERFAPEVREPSGLTFHPGKNCLVVVGDEGQLAEISLAGDTLLLKFVGGDLEGIVADPDRQVMYAVDENAGDLLVLDWEDYTLIDRLNLSAIVEKAGLSAKGKDGFEGIAYQASIEGAPPTLWLGHQRQPTAMVPLVLEGDPIRVSTREKVDVPIKEISGMSFDPRNGDLWVLSDNQDAAFRITLQGEILEKRAIPGKNQEGLAILPDGSWWIADDTGGVFKIEPELP